MNTPNKLTVLRIFLIPFFVFFLLNNFTVHNLLIAGLIFAAASITDHFDGKIARDKNLVTDFGKFADPLADKILVMSAFICFIELRFIESAVVVIMLAREFIVTSVRLVAVDKGTVISANIWGKLKTVSQIISILVVLVLQYILQLFSYGVIPTSILGPNIALETLASVFNLVVNIFVWVSAIFTVASGMIYVWDNRDFIKNM